MAPGSDAPSVPGPKAQKLTSCPGCGLQLPEGDCENDGYYNASPECLNVYNEVLGTEFGHLLLFSRAHQLTVDTYAVQHAGANHKDKSVCVHLVGLHLVELVHDWAAQLWSAWEPQHDAVRELAELSFAAH